MGIKELENEVVTTFEAWESATETVKKGQEFMKTHPQHGAGAERMKVVLAEELRAEARFNCAMASYKGLVAK